MKPPTQRIGLIGSNGAGKSAVCEFLTGVGFRVVSLSDIVRAELRHLHKAETRDIMVETANQMKAQYGMAVLAQRAFQSVSESGSNRIAFDSVRNGDEVRYLIDHGVVFLGINAPVELRYQRVISRQRASDLIDFETFKLHDDRENLGQSSGQNIFQAFEFCQTIVDNSGSLDYLHAQVRAFLNSEFGGGF